MLSVHAAYALLLTLTLVACGKSAGGEKPANGDQTPEIGMIPLPIPAQPMPLRAMKDRSTDEFCVGISEFLQNYTATKLPGTQVALMKIDGATCLLDSSPSNINLRMAAIFSKSGKSLMLNINFVTAYSGDTFGSSTLFVDRKGSRIESFEAGESDKDFGDLSLFKNDLATMIDMQGASFKIHGILKSLAYQRIESAFAPGNRRSLISSPKLRVELNKSSLKITEVDPSYFLEAGKADTFLRCPNQACLGNELTYEFQGLDLVLLAKPYIGSNNQPVKAPTHFRISADWLK